MLSDELIKPCAVDPAEVFDGFSPRCIKHGDVGLEGVPIREHQYWVRMPDAGLHVSLTKGGQKAGQGNPRWLVRIASVRVCGHGLHLTFREMRNCFLVLLLNLHDNLLFPKVCEPFGPASHLPTAATGTLLLTSPLMVKLLLFGTCSKCRY